MKTWRSTSGRFQDHVEALAKMVADRHGLTPRRAKKLIGLALTDARIIAVIFEHINRQITGRGDGITLVDLAENKDIRRFIKRDEKRRQANAKPRKRG